MIERNGRSLLFIAEIKDRSPSGFCSTSVDPIYTKPYLFNLANTNPYVDMISWHTEEPWGGSLESLAEVLPLSTKTILAKGVHPNDEILAKIRALGVRRALVVGRLPAAEFIHNFCYLEPSSVAQLAEWKSILPVSKNVHYTAVWNARDSPGSSVEKFKTEAFEQARQVWSDSTHYLIQASGIKTIDDVHPLADGVLVGTNMPTFLKSLER